jgi:hypothetical protein
VVDKSLDARIAEALVVKQKVLDKALDNVQVIDQSITIKDLALFT